MQIYLFQVTISIYCRRRRAVTVTIYSSATICSPVPYTRDVELTLEQALTPWPPAP